MLRMIVAVLLMGVSMGPSDDTTRTQAIRLAKKTLSKEPGMRGQKIRVQEVVSVEWPDASLGCPQKGRRYPLVVTRGYRVVLEVAGKTYRVHVGGGRAVLCEHPLSSSKVYDKDIGAAARMYELAREDLASRLKVAKEEVKANFIRPLIWPDASLGCPQPDMNYAQVMTPGFLIELEVAGKTYAYHSDRKRVVLCEKR